MNASPSSINLIPEKLQSSLSVSDLRSIEINNPSRETPNGYDSTGISSNSKEGYYFFDVLKPPSLQIQESPTRSPKKAANPVLQKSNTQNIQIKEDIQLLHAKYQAEIKELKKNFSLHSQEREAKFSNSEKQLSIFEARAKAAELETQNLKVKYNDMKDQNYQFEEMISNLTRKLEKSLRSNRLLMERGTELDETLAETQKRWLKTKKEYESLSQWVDSNKESLQDYEGAMKVSNAFVNLPEGLPKEFPAGSKVLTNHVETLVNCKKDLQLRIVQLSKEVNETRLLHEVATQKYLIDTEKKNSQMESLSSAQEISKEQILSLKAEVEKQRRENLKSSNECTRLQEELRLLISKSNDEMSELQSKASSQLRTIRDQFESDRLEFRMTLDKVTKEKVDLQAEIGQLLRDRRTAVSEMYQRDLRLDKFF